MKLQIESRGTLYRGVCQVLHESYRRFILVTREQQLSQIQPEWTVSGP